MNRIALLACGVLLPATLSGWDITDAGVCTAGVQRAIFGEVRDAAPQAPAGSGATGTVRDGSFSDELSPYDVGENALRLKAAYERPGTYTVTVGKPGYQQ